jgi:hypothetical protein
MSASALSAPSRVHLWWEVLDSGGGGLHSRVIEGRSLGDAPTATGEALRSREQFLFARQIGNTPDSRVQTNDASAAEALEQEIRLNG